MAKPTPTRRSSGTRAGSRFLLVTAGVLTAVMSLTAARFAYVVYLAGQGPRVKVASLSETLGGEEPMNVLVLGSDTREGLTEAEQAELGTTADVGGRRSDTLILVHIDPDREKTVMVHFPRDLRVDIPGHGSDKINTAFTLGGPTLVVETVAAMTHLPIHHYVEVDFIGFKRLVDALGGVEICVDRPIVDELSGIRIRKPGCSEFDGVKALKFVRARHVEGDAIPDFARIGRQQQFIRALFNKLIRVQSLLSDEVIKGATSSITTDVELSTVEMLDLGRRLRNLGPTAVDFRVVPGIAGPSFVEIDEAKADRLFERLGAGEPLGRVGSAAAGTAPSPAAIKVLVLDAGAPRAAASVHSRLLSAGFAELGVRDAPAELTRNEILHRPDAADRAQVVLGYFPDLEVREAPRRLTRNADVVVVVAGEL